MMVNIGEVFGIPEKVVEQPNTNVSVVNLENNDDFDQAKGSIKGLIQKGTSSLEDLLELAKNTEHPRAYEVVATLIKTLVDANKELTDISLKQNKGDSPNITDNRSVHNHLHLSTSDLLKMIKNNAKGEDGE